MIARILEEALDEWKAPGYAVEDQRRAIAILHAGGMHLDAQHQAEGVGDEVALLALDPLAGIEADVLARLRAGLTLWLSTIAAVGLSSRPSSSRLRR